MLFPGIGFTSASWGACRAMNGGPAIFSAGSNQLGTSVVCTAHVICPSGAASAAVAMTTTVSETSSDARSLMVVPLSVIPGRDVSAPAEREVDDEASGPRARRAVVQPLRV